MMSMMMLYCRSSIRDDNRCDDGERVYLKKVEGGGDGHFL